jgi:EmrB/QacA subfamily drug resistance transporter
MFRETIPSAPESRLEQKGWIKQERGESKRLILLGLMLAFFLAAIDLTVVSTALPKAVASLGGVDIYSWVFNAYLLAATISGPLWGRISDLKGSRRIFVVGIVLFLVGSALAGASASMVELVVFRAIQGAGAGALLTLGFIIVAQAFPLEERARVQGYTTSVWAVASIIGPLVGGTITDVLGWRWVFYINIPFGIASVLVIWRYMHDRIGPKEGRLDLSGALFFSVAALSLLAFLNGFTSAGYPLLPLAIISATAFSLFLFFERRSSTPLIPLHLFRNRIVTMAMAGNFVAGFAFLGTIAYLPILLQWNFGLSTAESGLMLIPSTLGWVGSSNIAARLVTRIGTKPLTLVGSASLAAGMAGLAFASPGLIGIIGAEILTGAGLGVVVFTLLIATQSLVTKDNLGVSTSLLNFLRWMGSSVGTAVMWIPISTVAGALAINSSNSTPILGAAQKAALSMGLSESFTIGLAVSLVAFPIYILFPGAKLGAAKAVENPELQIQKDLQRPKAGLDSDV